MDQPIDVTPEVVKPKKKMSGWIIALIVIVVLCCCLVVVMGIIGAVFMSNGDWSNLNMDDFQYLVPVLQFMA